jgi:signal transduction histidine kinase
MLRSLIYDDEKDSFSEWPAAQSLSGQVVKTGNKLFLNKKEIEAFAQEHKLKLLGTPAECWLGVPVETSGYVAGALIVQSYTNAEAFNPADVALLEMIAHETGLFIERCRMVKDLVTARDNAEAANRLKSEFLNNISHEIRTPLNGILGFGQMLAQGSLPEKEKKEYLRLLQQSSERIIKTMGDYMDASLIASRSLNRNFTEIGLNQFTDELFGYLQKINTNPDIAVKLRKPESEADIIIKGDKEYLLRALRHLLDNAVKFTLRGSIEFGYNLKGRETEFFVNDTGIGISKPAQNSVFDPFVQSDSGSTRNHDGNGLGLTIAQGFFKHHGGRIEVKSEPGQGSTFSAFLPGFDFKVNLKDLGLDEPVYNQRPLILIAEDEFVNFQYIEVLLRRAEVDYLHAPNGAIAVSLVEENPHTSIVLMDIKMPVMDGLEATRIIKAKHPGIPIIAITAFALSGDERKILEAGCNDYMAKPFRHEDLRRKLKAYGIII